MKVKDIVNAINKLAPQKLAYNWDNVGLQIGDPNWEANKILCSLDITPNTINKAIKLNYNLIVAHHPYIFNAIKNVTDTNIIKLIENKIAVLVAHTNLDVVTNGVNYTLANRLMLNNLKIIDNQIDNKFIEISTVIDNLQWEKIKNKIEKNTQFLKYYEQHNNKVNISFCIDEYSFSEIKKLFPNNENLIFLKKELYQNNPKHGLGLIGNLKQNMNIQEFGKFVKTQLNATFIKLWNPENKNKIISKVAICGGSGSSLISKIGKKADIFVSSDFNYHTILNSKIPLIDAGHFFTENTVFDNLIPVLKKLNVKVNLTDNHEIKFLSII